MILFILSEVMFFLDLFWAFFHSRVLGFKAFVTALASFVGGLYNVEQTDMIMRDHVVQLSSRAFHDYTQMEMQLHVICS